MGSAWRCRLSKDEDLVFQGFRVFGSVGLRVSRLWKSRVVLRFEVCGEVLQEVGFWFSAVAGLEPVLVGQKSGPCSVGWFRCFCCGGVCVLREAIAPILNLRFLNLKGMLSSCKLKRNTLRMKQSIFCRVRSSRV